MLTLTTATPWDQNTGVGKLDSVCSKYSIQIVSDDIQIPSSFDTVLQWFFQAKIIKDVNDGGGTTLTIQSKHLETPPSETGLNEHVKVNVRSLP